MSGYDDPMSRDTYHHGDLKAVILRKAAALVAERGADAISLRELAREVGVSHAAPAHHFTDRRGLFTAVAAEGWRNLAQALDAARPDFINAALAYVRFALDHRGHYAVMFDRSLVNPDDPSSPRPREDVLVVVEDVLGVVCGLHIPKTPIDVVTVRVADPVGLFVVAEEVDVDAFAESIEGGEESSCPGRVMLGVLLARPPYTIEGYGMGRVPVSKRRRTVGHPADRPTEVEHHRVRPW